MYYLDKEGKPISIFAWDTHMKEPSYKVVKQEWHGNLLVSSVWVGFVDIFGRFFETVIFIGEPHNIWRPMGYIWRYKSLKEAEEGHRQVMKDLTEGRINIEEKIKNELDFNKRPITTQ